MRGEEETDLKMNQKSGQFPVRGCKRFVGYKKNSTTEPRAAADKVLSDFLIQLERGITRLGSGTGKIVLLKDVYLAGNAEDATDYLRPAKKKKTAEEAEE